MNAEQARQRTQEAAERAREMADMSTADEEGKLFILEGAIKALAFIEKGNVDKAIEEAADANRSQTTYTYTERISASRNSREEVAFIIDASKLVAQRVMSELIDEGFKVTGVGREVVDFRENIGSPPEYFDTEMSIHW